MKGLAKKIWTVALIIVLALGTVGTAYASSTVTGNNSQLIKKKDSDYAGYEKVKDNPAEQLGNATLKVSRQEDKFNIYQLTEVSWVDSASTGAKNLVVEWVTPVKEWITNEVATTTSAFYNKRYYLDPISLGKQEDPNNNHSFKDEVDDEESVVVFLRAIRENEELMEILNRDHKVGFHTGDAVEDGNSNHTTNANCMTVAPVTTTVNDKAVFQGAYSLENSPLGLLFVDASSSARTYQPVLIDLMPEQVGPTGNWYIKKKSDLTFTLKYEAVGIKKYINGIGNKSDIVRVGEIVTFDVVIEIPKYPVDKDGNYEYTTFNVFDNMTQGFTLVPTSATLYYKDQQGRINHPTPSLLPDTFGNLTVSDSDDPDDDSLGTYFVNLNSTAYVYYDEATGEDVDLYATVTATATESTPEEVSFWGLVDGEFISLGNVSESVAVYDSVIKTYNTALARAGHPAITANKNTLKKRDYTKSTLSIRFNYSNLMKNLRVKENEDGTGADTAELFTPYTIHIQYDAVVNDNMYVGTDDNTNTVIMYYIGDSSGKIDTAKDVVTAWTYAMNIVKVDGDTYKKEPVYEMEVDETGNPTDEYKLDGDGNKIQARDENDELLWEDPDYLEGAVFDLYRLDATYCGGAEAKTAPDVSGGSAADLSSFTGYSFLKDAYGRNYTDNRNAWVGTAGARYSDGLLFKGAKFEVTMSGAPKPTWEATIGAKVGELVAATGDYSTLDKYTNRWGAVSVAPEIFKNYITTEVKQGTMDYFYEPVEVESCDEVATPHYHVRCYHVLWNDITSTDTVEGVTVKGLDPNDYIVIETKAPNGFHKLASGMKYNITAYTQDDDQYLEAGSFKGFMDKTTSDAVNHIDGVYEIVVENYSGLVLPSTGGIGTLIFTIIGISLMGGVVLLILVKRKKEQYEY